MTIKFKGVFVRTKYFYNTVTIFVFLIVNVGMLSANQIFAEGDIEAGRAKSQVCSACHGQDGNSTNPEWPSLAGQHEKYFIATLEAYTNGTRNNTIMYPLAMTLSEQDMMDLAAYYQTQAPVEKTYDYELAKQGESLYRGGNSSGVAACIACHGPTGRGNPGAVYPSIAGQHSAYTKTALNEYINGNRKPGINNMMQTITPRMTADEIEAVAEYIQALGAN
jgi:cytochrome c553|tara:strand:- start:30 stop:692 length:663 start_codon:yes stop_codon:yes gene_type:complete